MSISIAGLVKKGILSKEDSLHLVTDTFVDHKMKVSNVMKASERIYDNSSSGLAANNMQSAVEELETLSVTSSTAYYAETAPFTILVTDVSTPFLFVDWYPGVSDVLGATFTSLSDALSYANKFVSSDRLSSQKAASTPGADVLITIIIDSQYTATSTEQVTLSGGDYRHIRIINESTDPLDPVFFSIKLDNFCKGPAITGGAGNVEVFNGSSVSILTFYRRIPMGGGVYTLPSGYTESFYGNIHVKNCSHVTLHLDSEDEAGNPMYSVDLGVFPTNGPLRLTDSGSLRIENCSTVSKSNLSRFPTCIIGGVGSGSIYLSNCSELITSTLTMLSVTVEGCSKLEQRPWQEELYFSSNTGVVVISGCSDFICRHSVSGATHTITIEKASTVHVYGDNAPFNNVITSSCSGYFESVSIAGGGMSTTNTGSSEVFIPLRSESISLSSVSVTKGSKTTLVSSNVTSNIAENQYVDQGVLITQG